MLRNTRSKLMNILFHLHGYDCIQFSKFLIRFSDGEQTLKKSMYCVLSVKNTAKMKRF
jgi:hypothetical protein